MDTSIEDLRALVAQSILSTEAFKNQLAASQEAADRIFAESKAEADRRAAEADKTMEELKQQIKATDRQIKELGKQIGGLGNKFGSFTEGLLLPSVGKILADYFGATNFLPRIRSRKNGREFEADAFAYSNAERNLGVVVEIKSDAEVRHIKQLRQTMEELPVFYPEFAHLRLQGLLTAVDGITAEVRREAEKAGIFVVVITDKLLEFTPPDASFQPFTILPKQRT